MVECSGGNQTIYTRICWVCLLLEIDLLGPSPLQKELNLYVDKNGTVFDLLQEAANEVS